MGGLMGEKKKTSSILGRWIEDCSIVWLGCWVGEGKRVRMVRVGLAYGGLVGLACWLAKIKTVQVWWFGLVDGWLVGRQAVW